MSNMLEIKVGSTIYERIDAIRMSDAERLVAINAMRDADMLVDAFIWAGKKIEWISERLYRFFLKPSLKH